MKVSREQAAQNREKILAAAAQLFRERGFEGIGVADLMKEAGLTHGGFYGHFESKEDLMAQACMRASEGSKALWSKLADSKPDDPLGEIARVYMTPRHRDEPGRGCLIAALAAESPRQGRTVRRAITESLRSSFEFLAKRVPGRSPKRKRDEAIVFYASLVGGMILARAVDDRALSNEILEAVRRSVTTRS